MATAKKVRVTYTKSAIGYAQDQKATVQALGLKKLHQTVEHVDGPVLRGMVRKVAHLVTLEGPAGKQAGGPAGKQAEGPAGKQAEESA